MEIKEGAYRTLWDLPEVDATSDLHNKRIESAPTQGRSYSLNQGSWEYKKSNFCQKE